MTRDRDRRAPEDFLKVLSETLDIASAIEKFGITREHARAILKGFLRHDLKEGEGFEARPLKGHAPQAGLFKDALLKKEEKKGRVAVFEIYVDGASRGNPGVAGAGAVIKDQEGNVIKRLKKYLGTATNNEAEYQALIMALQEARSMNIRSISVFADSELVVKQVKGEYKVKSLTLKPFNTRALGLLSGFEAFSITHVEREKNKAADSLANEAIDRRPA